MSQLEDKIHEAAQSKRLIELTAKKKDGTVVTRIVEPYSYRTKARNAETGERLLVCYDVTRQGVRSFVVDNITNVNILDTKFEPRYDIEL